ncbi:hypothetical protein JR316_0005382 [Psilocybe cubensis]|uniref:Uncharacterized protein n=2 Tax=Psilocybe cubensis TaxID=181762 RepID=A0A8H8CE99_PSICU|nr:hypothetical protein JR316_0005382 [Psilocybe cubensis]KAH9483278.1 hypothetical protein JR316_0005382 [Psilocybe cubensis]
MFRHSFCSPKDLHPPLIKTWAMSNEESSTPNPLQAPQTPISAERSSDRGLARPLPFGKINTANILQRGTTWLCRLAAFLLDAPVYPGARIFFYYFRYVRVEGNDAMDTIDNLGTNNLHIVSTAYMLKVENMFKAWESIKLASLFLIGTAPVILQIEPVYMNLVPRMFTVSSGLFAVASLVSSHIYLQARDRFIKTRIMEETWRSSAMDPDAKFWKLVALPFAFVSWSGIFFLGTVAYFIWGIAFALNPIPDGASKREKGVQYGELLLSATFVSAIPMYAFYKIYSAMKEIHAK